jgi:endoglycosylceramidase
MGRRPRISALAARAAIVGAVPALAALIVGAAPALARARAAAIAPLSFLHVGGRAGPDGLAQIRDAAGRAVLLRGVNVNGLEDYYANTATPTAVAYPVAPAAYADHRCPANDTAVESMAVCSFDARQLASFGYDAVRLAISWSLLEPEPGRVSRVYIARIAQVVGWLRARGIYSVIDMHQDAWSKYLYTPPGGRCPPPLQAVSGFHEADGAPAWASAHLAPVCYVGAREADPAVQEDFQRFWSDLPASDGVGLAQHYADALAAVAARFARDPAVAGYDLFNEPSPGYTPPPEMDATEVYPFYARVIATIRRRAPGFRQLFFIEPDVTRDVTDSRYALVPWSTYSSYRNVVYEPHVYTHVFTPDGLLGVGALAPLFPVRGGYDAAAADARALGLPLWVGEFGADVADDATLLASHYVQQDALGIGGSLWVWKADPAGPDGFSVMHGPFGAGTPFPSRVLYTDRVYPVAIAGTLRRFAYDPLAKSFRLLAAADGRRGGAPSIVYLPARVPTRVQVAGARWRIVAAPAGAHELYLWPRGGAYSASSASG